MKNNLLFDFDIDKENNTINIKKEFAAPLPLLWDAWTKPEIQDQWWAPKPWVSKTKSYEFRPGGHRLYAMISPEGEEHWGISTYKTIVDEVSFDGTDAFCDDNGTINKEMPVSEFGVNFSASGEHTLVENYMRFTTLEQLETTIQMGFKEGMTMALDNLDEVLHLMSNK